MRKLRSSVRNGFVQFGRIAMLVVLALALTAGQSDAKRKNKQTSRDTQQQAILEAYNAATKGDFTTMPGENDNAVNSGMQKIRSRDAQIKENITDLVGDRGQRRQEMSEANKAVGEAEADLTEAQIELRAAAEDYSAAQVDFKRRNDAANSTAATNSDAPPPKPLTASDVGELAAKRKRLEIALNDFKGARQALATAVAAMKTLEDATLSFAQTPLKRQQRALLIADNVRLRAEQMQITRGLLGILSFGAFASDIAAKLLGQPAAAAAPSGAANAGTAASSSTATNSGQATATPAQQAAALAAQQAANAALPNTGVYGPAPAFTNIYGPAPPPAGMENYGQTTFSGLG